MDGGTQVLVFILSFAVFGGSGTQVSFPFFFWIDHDFLFPNHHEVIVSILITGSTNFPLTGATITTVECMTTAWRRLAVRVQVEINMVSGRILHGSANIFSCQSGHRNEIGDAVPEYCRTVHNPLTSTTTYSYLSTPGVYLDCYRCEI